MTRMWRQDFCLQSLVTNHASQTTLLVFRSRPPLPILSQHNLPTFHFLKIHLNIILPPMPVSPKWLFPLGFPTKTLYTSLLSPIRATCPTHLILLDFITRTILGEEYRWLSSSLCSCSQIYELFLPFNGTIINIYTVTSSCILILRNDHVRSIISIHF